MQDMPASLGVALKEWSVVCDALAQGEQIVLLRKGGIHDTEGVFELEERHFLLFPTLLHQQPGMVKPAYRQRIEPVASEPHSVALSAAATVTDIVRLPSRSAADALFDLHIWDTPQIDMRFNYKPTHPLYLVLLRACVLPAPVTVENTPAYAGCKSWVPLDRSIDLTHATAALDDDAYQARRDTIAERLAAHGVRFRS